LSKAVKSGLKVTTTAQCRLGFDAARAFGALGIGMGRRVGIYKHRLGDFR
jgi:hypothetical protein